MDRTQDSAGLLRRLRRLALVAFSALVIAVAVASCGNDDGDGGSETAAGSSEGSSESSGTTENVPGVTDSEIVLGMVTTLTGPNASAYGETTVDAAKARIELVNEAGGIGGRKIRLEVADDASNPQQNLSATQTLVDQKDVFGVITASSLATGSYRWLNDNGVPTFGGHLGEAGADEANKFLFGYSGSSNATYPGFGGDVKFFKDMGVSKVCAAAYEISAVGVNTTKGLMNALKKEGIEVPVEDYAVQLGATDFSASVLKMKDSGCDGLYTSMSLVSNLALTTALSQAGVKLKASYIVAGYTQAVLDTEASKKASEGLMFASYFAPPQLETDATKTFMDALTKYAGLKTPNPYGSHWWGWAEADLAITGLEAAGDDITRESVVDALRQVHDYDVGGLLGGPVDFSKWGFYHPAGPGNCIWMSKVENGEFVPVSDQPFCGDAIAGTEAA